MYQTVGWYFSDLGTSQQKIWYEINEKSEIGTVSKKILESSHTKIRH